jgi:hypothetical protein
VTTHLHPDLTALLLRPINPRRVFRKDGQSHLAAWDVRAHLIRCFGFAGWSAETVAMELIHDLETTTKAGKPARKVAYRAHVRLTIHETGATYSEWATGEATMPDFKHGDAHDFALKTAESQALKRCATNLGSQFGLSLYDNGNADDVVRGVFSVKFADDVEVKDEGQEPGVAVDTETGEVVEDRPAERLSAVPPDDPFYSAPGVAGGEASASGAAPTRTAPKPSPAQTRLMWAKLRHFAGTTDEQRAALADILRRPVESTEDFTANDVRRVIDHFPDLPPRGAEVSA